VPRNYRYFNESLIEVNLVFSFGPRPFTTAMIANAIPAAINPYSIAVAPDWSAQNLRANVTMRGRRRRSDQEAVSAPQLPVIATIFFARKHFVQSIPKNSR
jgi:hypothetical protein